METDLHPLVSVVVDHRSDDLQAIRSLDSVACQTLREGVEVIVSCRSNADRVSARYPSFRFLDDSRPKNRPLSLHAALCEAHGAIIAVTNTDCTFPPDWLEKMLLSHAASPDFPVIGGAVAYSGRDAASGWAAYYADYGPFLPHTPRTETALLAGCHVSYKRAVVEGAIASMTDGYWKVFFHLELERRGVRFLFDPELVCSCVVPESGAGFAIRYFRNGRQFAAKRSSQMPAQARLMRIVACPALPAVLLIRRIRPAWRNAENRPRVLGSVPLLLIFVFFWSAGEFVGYLCGPPQSAGLR